MSNGLVKKILVVEDDNMLRNLIVESLHSRFSVDAAVNGREAVEKILHSPPDLIVLDLLLPQLDGFGILKQLRTMPDGQLANIPVVILTNYEDEDSIKKAKDLGISEYFMKRDITMGFMVNRISNLLA